MCVCVCERERVNVCVCVWLVYEDTRLYNGMHGYDIGITT